MERKIYTAEHEEFRQAIRQFFEREALPRYSQWEGQGYVDPAFFLRMGELGYLGMQVPVEFGGSGIESYKYNAVLNEEAAAAGLALGSLRTHLDLVYPYLQRFANPEQKKRWLPGFASGEVMTAIAMTEPDTGSDLAGIRTTARRTGDVYIVNGAKTFITGGRHAGRVLLVCRTSPPEDGNRRAGLTLLAVDSTSPGFTSGRMLEKLGLKAQDTCELSFDDVRVPVEDRIGEEGQAFRYLTQNLPQERLVIAIGAVASARRAIEHTVDYTRSRKAFGTPVAGFQNTKFVLADCAADVAAGQALVDNALEQHDANALAPAQAALVKLWTTEMQSRVVDKCLQLHGGYGYITEYPIAKLYADARVTRILGGTSEVMRTVIAKSMQL
ncbi:acyl-CoA dehydrogenase family protein [Rhodococcus erythropolis]|uniref:acyl-CoA dehydrogenase family protein n=1 Tax=Rhodococcus erythropolis TaxID=1833 RepID=UPI00210A5077|nr:acyl-CoA dehydrogenase family protein [Rhodococcus erythropolis]MCQ4129154.1 acyl-CoA dehydrogenase family protein [Rhodococcus erythropolis]